MSLRTTSVSERDGCEHLDASSHLVHRQVGIHSMWYRPCLSCNAWLPLGHSDESRVAVEVRAAEIAAVLGASNEDLIAVTSFAERRGLWLHAQAQPNKFWGLQGGCTDADCAGYLARCIHTHKDETP